MKSLLTIAILAWLTTGCEPRAPVTENPSQDLLQKNASLILYLSAFPDGKVEVNGWITPLDVAIDRIKERSVTQTQARYYYATQHNQTPPIAAKILSALVDAQLDIQLINKAQPPVLTDNSVKAATRIVTGSTLIGYGPIAIPTLTPRRSKSLFAPPFFPPDSIRHYHLTVKQNGRSYPVTVAQYGKSWFACIGSSIREPWHFEPVVAFSPEDCLALIRSQYKLKGKFIKGKRTH